MKIYKKILLYIVKRYNYNVFSKKLSLEKKYGPYVSFHQKQPFYVRYAYKELKRLGITDFYINQ
ncbi:MAG: hypothetical protein M0R46_00270 [Candidatus Muirbacterium halophilum]|nr:hypothetical protein [Candidatus Muirbacterium halophilum]MCK9474327.1 hypothetical protein [Candidatus Muirbacterium halophilum]